MFVRCDWNSEKVKDLIIYTKKAPLNLKNLEHTKNYSRH